MVITYFHILEKAKWWHLKWEKVELKAFLEIFSRTFFFFFFEEKILCRLWFVSHFSLQIYELMKSYIQTFWNRSRKKCKNIETRINSTQMPNMGNLFPERLSALANYFSRQYINNVNCKMSSKIRSYRES